MEKAKLNANATKQRNGTTTTIAKIQAENDGDDDER